MNSLETLQAALGDRYTFEREIGSGGMATVYLARDIKHGRSVAVKVLKPELGAVLGAERFLSEISVTANLQHPNLLPLFDSGEASGLLFYVMPFVRGETLRARIDREKQLPVEEAVRIAVAIASALGYAHEYGIIHRDLKPENILIQAGQPVIADFGIALAVSNAGGTRVTQTGLSLGTPQYMSPEQAAGDRVIDARSDIYSLGAVTYEMLGGEPPHSGTSAQAIIAKLMTTEPQPLQTLRKSVPLHVACGVEKALAKLPADRFAHAEEFATALQNPAFTIPSRPGVMSPRGANDSRLWKGTALGMAVLAAASGAVAIWGVTRPKPTTPTLRYTLAFDSAETIGGARGRLAISPDGSTIVYTGGNRGQLYVRRRSQLVSMLLPGTENAMNPVFSPDGRKIAFFTPGSGLRIVSVQGGPPLTVTDSLVGNGGQSWGKDGILYADATGGGPLVRVSATPGGRPRPFTALDTTAGEVNHNWPDVLPGGRGVLFTVHYGAKARSGSAIGVADTETGKHQTLLGGGTLARYSPSGHILYVTEDGTLMAVAFDQKSLKVAGEPTAVVDGLRVGNGSDVAISENGTLIYATGGLQGGREFVWVSRDGKAERVDSAWVGDFADPALSPDGKRLAVSRRAGGRTDVWIKQLDRGPSLKLTTDGMNNGYPSWRPDGRAVTFFSDRGQKTRELWTQRSDGSAKAELQLRDREDLFESHWSPNGEWLVVRARGAFSADILGVRPGVDSRLVPLVSTPKRDVGPTLSPDGRWMAYESGESGQLEIYVVPFPNTTDAKWPISVNGGYEPLWSRDGRELFYRDDTNHLMSDPVKTSPSFEPGTATTLFPSGQFNFSGGHRGYDVSPDGRRFLMTRPVGIHQTGNVVVVENWFAELKASSK